tara:strand:- start:1142 stop:1702 length:561 start_codon:yes stop_codon:yes gene_type:complete
MNLYDVDNSIKIKDPLWKSASEKYFSFMKHGLLHYEDNWVDTLLKLRTPLFYIIWILYFALQGDETIPFWFGLLNIIMSLFLYLYSTFVYNKISGKNQCNYTQLTIPSFDYYLIPKILFIVLFLFIYYNNSNILLGLYLVLSLSLYFGFKYLTNDFDNSLKCFTTNIGGIYLYLIIISIITFIKGT